jgi:hypothetical protein
MLSIKSKNKNLKSFGVEKPTLSHEQAVKIGKIGGLKYAETMRLKKKLKLLREDMLDDILTEYTSPNTMTLDEVKNDIKVGILGDEHGHLTAADMYKANFALKIVSKLQSRVDKAARELL